MVCLKELKKDPKRWLSNHHVRSYLRFRTRYYCSAGMFSACKLISILVFLNAAIILLTTTSIFFTLLTILCCRWTLLLMRFIPFTQFASPFPTSALSVFALSLLRLPFQDYLSFFLVIVLFLFLFLSQYHSLFSPLPTNKLLPSKNVSLQKLQSPYSHAHQFFLHKQHQHTCSHSVHGDVHIYWI